MGFAAVFYAPIVPAGYAERGPNRLRHKRDSGLSLLRHVALMSWGQRTSATSGLNSTE